MPRTWLSLAAAAALMAFGFSAPAEAGGRSFLFFFDGEGHPQSDYYHGRPQVRGYSKRVGGYSFSRADVLNNPGDRIMLQQPIHGGQGAPFDSGFFFDSNVTSYGGQAPYQN